MTVSAPMVPPPPARLSTTTVCPKASLSFCPMLRAMMSVPPPGANGTTSLTGRTGYFCCASIAPAATSSASPPPAKTAYLLMKSPGEAPSRSLKPSRALTRKKRQQLLDGVALDVEDGIGDRVHRQLRVDAAELLDDALLPDGVGG